MSPSEFLTSDKLVGSNYLIESVDLPRFDQETVKLKVFKTSHRAQNAHSYVNAGFRFEFTKGGLKLTDSTPTLVFNGIANNFNRATKTEKFLVNKDLSDENVLKQSIAVLLDELNNTNINEDSSSSSPLIPSPKYRITLAVSFLYKFLLTLNNSKCSANLKTAIESLVDSRDISKSEQKFQSNAELFPLTQPLAKLNALAQTSGEVKYAGDLYPLMNQLNGVLVKSTQANAAIESVDVSEAMAMPGVVRVFLAKDIPGINNILNKVMYFDGEPLFADKRVQYFGQPIGLVVARSEPEARMAAARVKVNYTDVKKPILSIDEAVAANSLHVNPPLHELKKGDAKEAINNSKHKISGEYSLDSTQFNFYLEVYIIQQI
jgi:xanthine dehydrogenase/oxidase